MLQASMGSISSDGAQGLPSRIIFLERMVPGMASAIVVQSASRNKVTSKVLDSCS